MTRGDSAGPRLGLVADVHANLQALEAALAWLDARGVDDVWCLGDVVGYGGDPEACVALVRERCAGTVRGNHDAAVVDPSLLSWFNPHARQAAQRHAEILSADAKAWLDGLPWTLDLGEVALVHAGFADPPAFDYVLNARQAAVELAAQPARWGFVGHTHVPGAWRRGEDGAVERLSLQGGDEGIDVDLPGKVLVNPGAVGQPRDRDPRAACALLDTRTRTLLHARVDYDIAAAQAAARGAGMPAIEAERLASGM